MKVTIAHNTEKDGMEISFDSKPDREILDYLKAKKFKWSNFNKVWYQKYSDSLYKAVEEALSNKDFAVSQDQPKSRDSKAAAKPSKNLLPYPQQCFYVAFMKHFEQISRHAMYMQDPEIKVYRLGEDVYLNHSYLNKNSWGQETKETSSRWFCITPKGKVVDQWQMDIKPESLELKEVNIPVEVHVPQDKLKPHYDISFYPKDYKDRPKFNRSILLMELISGKMDVATKKSFDGMTDSWNYVSNSDLEWHDPNQDEYFWDRNLSDFYNKNHEHPWLDSANLIDFGSHSIRYKPGGIEKTVKSVKKDLSKEEALQIAEILREKAAAMADQIYKKRNPATMHQNPTHRRARIVDGMIHDADVLSDIQAKLNALAEAWINGTIPESLKAVRSKADIDRLKGYFPNITKGAGDWYVKEAGERKKALKRLGITTESEFKVAQDDLHNLGKFELSAEEETARKIRTLENDWIGTKEPGFHPTPKELAREIVQKAGIETGDKVLEPSAGMGHIAEQIRELNPDADLKVIEKFHKLREILEIKGFNVVANDFLEYQGNYLDFEANEGLFDKIIMNPPFENGQDIQHVKHAYKLLKPGGRIVAIMSEGPFFRSSKADTDFREWHDEVNAISEKLPEGSFKSSFISTGVNTRVVVIDKPENVKRKELDKLRALKTEAAQDENNSDKARKYKVAKAKAWAQAQRIRILALAAGTKQMKEIFHTGVSNLHSKRDLSKFEPKSRGIDKGPVNNLLMAMNWAILNNKIKKYPFIPFNARVKDAVLLLKLSKNWLNEPFGNHFNNHKEQLERLGISSKFYLETFISNSLPDLLRDYENKINGKTKGSAKKNEVEVEYFEYGKGMVKTTGKDVSEMIHKEIPETSYSTFVLIKRESDSYAVVEKETGLYIGSNHSKTEKGTIKSTIIQINLYLTKIKNWKEFIQERKEDETRRRNSPKKVWGFEGLLVKRNRKPIKKAKRYAKQA